MVTQRQQPRYMVFIPSYRDIHSREPIRLCGGLVPGSPTEHITYQRACRSIMGWSDSWDCLLRGGCSVLALGSTHSSIPGIRSRASPRAHGRFDCAHYLRSKCEIVHRSFSLTFNIASIEWLRGLCCRGYHTLST